MLYVVCVFVFLHSGIPTSLGTASEAEGLAQALTAKLVDVQERGVELALAVWRRAQMACW